MQFLVWHAFYLFFDIVFQIVGLVKFFIPKFLLEFVKYIISDNSHAKRSSTTKCDVRAVNLLECMCIDKK